LRTTIFFSNVERSMPGIRILLLKLLGIPSYFHDVHLWHVQSE
jgi:hypothetical protein